MKSIIALLFIVCVWANSPIKYAAETFISEQFSEDVHLSMHTLTLPPKLKSQIQNKVKQVFHRENLYYWKITREDSTIAYAFLDNVIGKSMPITFLVLLNQEGNIMASQVVKYREAYGSEVGNKKWLSQFLALSKTSDFVVGKNIDGISGATISVNSLTRGIQKITCLYPEIKNLLN
ncbi:MAG: FMN-binding protein [Candidatus Marinimicrobia bacterium]|jgi:Na+-translocating ferredoxin:NAD+ oxidoreductase RnfG subunit|nr:FMN-binding protein [Candidatus Neomarinimicrobiota bacterium]